MRKSILYAIIILVIVYLTSCSRFSSASISEPADRSQGQVQFLSNNDDTTLWRGDTPTIWHNLHRISSAQLKEMQKVADEPLKIGWIKLARISKKNSIDTQQLARELLAWRERYPAHPANTLLATKEVLNQLLASPPPQRIAILLPQTGAYASASLTVREGFLHAYYANLAKLGTQNVKFYDTTQAPNLISVYQQAEAEGADFIIGPLTKEDVVKLAGGINFHTPTLALNYTEVRDRLPVNFYEYGLLPEDEAGQIAERARQANRLHALVIAPQNGWGQRMVAAFAARWQSLGGSIEDTWFYANNINFNQEIAQFLKIDPNVDKELMRTDNNKTILSQQRRQDFDVIFLFSQPQQARSIVSSLKYYYASDVPIYATSAVYSGKPNPTKDVDLDGVIICDIPWHKQLDPRAAQKNKQMDRLYAVGQDAYLLSQTLHRLTQLPHFPLYGTTGALSLASNHQIHRRLPCTPIRNGIL